MPETNLNSIILEKYYDLLNIFLKKDLVTLLSHQKCDYKIILEE